MLLLEVADHHHVGVHALPLHVEGAAAAIILRAKTIGVSVTMTVETAAIDLAVQMTGRFSSPG